LRLKLDPGERVIVMTRPQARKLTWPVVAALLVLGAGSYVLGNLSRSNPPDWIVEWHPLLLAGLAVVVAALLSRLFLLPLLRWISTRYLLTSKRLIVRQGMGRRHERQLLLVNIAELHTEQSIIQRTLRSGNLTVDLGHGRTSRIIDVPEVFRFRTLVVEAIEQLPRTAMFDGVDMETETEWNSWDS
jgi:uncharacterized membrane protein YdbT with pleckstrin-like domain